MPKVFIVSLGCPKNLTDAEVMAGRLARAGFTLTSDLNEADAALINTCGFLDSAVKESEAEIERFLRLKRRGKLSKVAVTGCLVERYRESLLRKYPLLDAIAGINALEKIADSISGTARCVIPAAAAIAAPRFKTRLTAPHTAYLKVADGCGNHCAYCLIPSIRGPFRSKPLGDAVKEALSLAASGAAEISVIAQDTTSYGMDLYGRPRLYELLKKLAALPDVKWLRLMYVHPEKISANLLKLMRDQENICHYLDMPIQHISDNILKKMNRHSSGRSIRNRIALMRKTVPDIALRTNLIAGFPGETERDFKELLAFVEEAAFDKIGVFAYSREAGTSAAGLPGQLPEKVKAARVEAVIEAQSRVIDRKNAALKGSVQKVLMDSPNFGRTYREAPEIDGGVEIINSGKKNPPLKPGDFVNVKITGSKGYILIGKPC